MAKSRDQALDALLLADRDMHVFGSGFTKWYFRDGELLIDHIDPSEIYVEKRDK